MKKVILTVILSLSVFVSRAQFYLSATGGYSFGVPSAKIGQENNNGVSKVLYGTFGQGVNTQLRGGYLFNKSWGLDISLGYLHGDDQTVLKENSTRTAPFPMEVDANAISRGRAFGMALSAIYNFKENFYGRFGIITKIGGRTEVVVNSKITTTSPLPMQALQGMGLTLPQGLHSTAILKEGSVLETSYTEDYKGKIPFGTIAALGYKIPVNNKLDIFFEIEYMNIGVKRDYSELKTFTQNLNAIIIPNPASPSTIINKTIPVKSLDNFQDGKHQLLGQNYYQKSTFVDELDSNDTDKSKKLSEKASYSSLGFNFGLTYTF